MSSCHKQHVIILIDISSSMFPRARQLVSGLNNFVNSLKQRVDSQNIYLSLILFNTKLINVHNLVPVCDICTFGSSDVLPFGATFLYDAIGQVLNTWVPRTDMTHNLFIISDGEDTGSMFFSREQASQMCTDASQYGWNITHCDVDVSKLDSNTIRKVVYNADNIDLLFGSLAL